MYVYLCMSECTYDVLYKVCVVWYMYYGIGMYVFMYMYVCMYVCMPRRHVNLVAYSPNSVCTYVCMYMGTWG